MKWISVKECLPDMGTYVLVFLESETVLKGRHTHNIWTAMFSDGEKLVTIWEVTHWMPLPLPPSEIVTTPPLPNYADLERRISWLEKLVIKEPSSN